MKRPPPHSDGATTPRGEEAAGEALARAREHALRALAEALEAGRALLDAASLAATGARAGAHPMFASADHWISGVAEQLSSNARAPIGSELGPALAAALDAEIQRWELRARSEEEARAVLRAFLGLRELLWEVGVRPSGSSRASAAETAETSAKPGRRPVERVAVVGN